jgi:hypothetical protein
MKDVKEKDKQKHVKAKYKSMPFRRKLSKAFFMQMFFTPRNDHPGRKS